MTDSAAPGTGETGAGEDSKTVPVSLVRPGHLVAAPDGSSTKILSVSWEQDDYGQAAVAILGCGGGKTIRVSAASTIRLAGPPAPHVSPGARTGGTGPRSGSAGTAPRSGPAGTAPRQRVGTAVVSGNDGTSRPGAGRPAPEAAPKIPADAGTPEAVVAAAAAAHGGHETVQRLAGRLAKGLNYKSGANLQVVRDLVQVLFVELQDDSNAVAVAGLIVDLPYDANPGRWNPIEHCLAVSYYLARSNGDAHRAEQLAEALRAPDRAELDAFRAKINATVRQRSLDEPNLYDKEINRSIANGERDQEPQWRELRLNTLLHLLAHGGSRTHDDAELLRRINNELTEIRTRTSRSEHSG
ncbi:DUF6707 family protein [Arthrobacter sp. A5]|uniref:DUF6707 family protein n=1 Tax=Arthrobacter sp. A5 TaxID=576926 RepID=UPI003DA8D902